MGAKVRRWLRILAKSEQVQPLELDARGIPTAGCPTCGERWFSVPVLFDDETYEIGAWALEGVCLSCGTIVTVCCPVDKEAERYM